MITLSALVSDPTWSFFIVLLVILVAPLMRRFGLPSVVAMIVAGIAIGPHGLGLVERDRSFEIFGQVGVHYIMFLAALELDMGSVRTYGLRGLRFGLITFALPCILGALVSHWLMGFSPVCSLLMGCVYGSHTLVTYPLVGRYGLGRAPVVVVSVVATAIAMLLALVMLAIVVGAEGAASGARQWTWMGMKCLAFGLVLFGVYPRVARWFLRRYDDSVVQFIFVLGTMSASAAVASLCGLEGLLGAFLSGLVAGRLIPRTSPLTNRISFVGNALFIPYFLIGVGMMVDLSRVATWQSARTALCIIGAGTALKLLAAAIEALRGKRSALLPRLSVMFGLTNAHSAGALAIVMVASGAGLMEESVTDAVVMLILASCLISSFATGWGARRLAKKEAQVEDNRGSFHGRCLVTYSQPGNVDAMTMMAIMVHNPRIPDGIMGLSVAYDEENSDGVDRYQRGKRLLERAHQIATGADVGMSTLCRISTNIVSGIVHTMREYDCGEVIVSLADRTTGMPKSSLGTIIDSLLASQKREVLALRAVVPVGTLGRVVVAVPQGAEYEVGFYKWLEHVCRIVEQLGCPAEFCAHKLTLPHIATYLRTHHAGLIVRLREMNQWGQLMSLPQQLGDDELLVIVAGRKGSISYRKEFDALPLQIYRYFSHTSVMLLFPDEWGEGK